jgi:hypothetical protein
MGLNVKLRWFTEINRVTADDVLAARERGCGFALMTIKTILQEKSEPRLQYLDEEAFDSDREKWGLWVDVPHVVEYREGSLPFDKAGV